MKRILFLISALCLSFHTLAETLLPLSPAQLKQMQVQWGHLQAQQEGLSANYPAEVILPPTQTRVVTAPQGGLITRLDVSMGDTVKQGQVIGQLSSPDLVALQSNYLQSDTQARLHEQALKRDQELFKDGIIAQRRMQETQSAYETSQALMHERQQTLKLAGMSEAQIKQLAQKRSMQNGMAIVAPISGQIMEQQQQVGARVDMAMPIFTISNPKPLWLMIQVPIVQAQQLSAGTTVRLPKQNLTAKVDTVLRQLNKNNQTTQVRASISQGAEQLSVGQIVDVALVEQTTQGSFAVPRSAVARQGEQAVIFVQQPKGIAVIPVKVILEQDQQLTVRASLRGNETIAVQGVAALKGHWLGLGGE
ncbi:efflux RND transporter periplasmic adaptor subunit [Methylophilus sp. OH31]|uniref:efflux RND transporter periplasmic adaptor subunit n=1 Tax=Methylophilus sp. OH31 TaxID=1387312 RepID=UPI000465CA03|nr:efflux RND transporter periplasmic adaptor subunit [Methylophilus sp. OH31]